MFKKLLLIFSILMAVILTGCTSDVATDEESRYVPEKANILSTKTEGEYTKIVFEYPSIDPNNEPVGVSAIICMKTSFYNSNDKKADYTILVNHGATTKWDDVPSMDGGSELCSVLNELPQNVIGVATDYMGLGHFKDEPQAFAYGEVNAAAALDALIYAREILKKKGFSWEDRIANIGFSQGGQTAICVQKLVDTDKKYKKIHITKTFAGDGVYNIPLIIDYSLKNYNPPVFPSVILLGIVSYNYWSDLGIDESKVFLSPDLIDKYINSKNYDLVEGITNIIQDSLLSGLIKPADLGMQSITDVENIDYDKARQWSNFLTKDMLNPDSAIYKKVLKGVKGKNNYWKPSSNSNIVLFAADNDDVVPGKNAEELFNHFLEVSENWTNACEKDEGTTGSETSFNEDNVYIHYEENEPSTDLADVVHAKASSKFYRRVKAELKNW